MRIIVFLLSAASLHLVALTLSIGPLNDRVDRQQVGVTLVERELDVPVAVGVQGQPSMSPPIQKVKTFPEAKTQSGSDIVELRETEQDVIERSVSASIQAISEKPQTVEEQIQRKTESAIQQIKPESTATIDLAADADTVIQPPPSTATGTVVANKIDSDATAQISTVSPEPARPKYGHNPAPTYPQAARRRGWQGTVEFEVRVLPSGQVGGLQLRSSSGYRSLDEAARRAILRWRFSPATVSGAAVESWVVIPVHFVLDPKTAERD